MKIDIGKTRSNDYPEMYPGMFELFSHFEFATAIPHVMFAITTMKENGKPNINFHSWSCFHGDVGGFYAILTGLFQHTHTYDNLKRTGEFCINFLSMAYLNNLNKTIEKNDMEEDEFAIGKFTVEQASIVKAPRIAESFMSLECTVKQIDDISGAGKTAMIIGEVQNVALDKNFANGMERYGIDGFMMLCHSPLNYQANEYNKTMAATLLLGKET